MSLPLDHLVKIELRLPSSHPQLLAGLDIWLRLGLISDTQVRQICREFLVCPVIFIPQVQPETAISDAVKPLPVEALTSNSRRQTPKPPPEPNFVTSMLQSLGAELSVRWLLFLGLFLVVVSSGVLAASQWERFPASGQYGVLFAYTLSFWGFSFWANRQNNLNLTAQTLLIVTLLLVPVNFWAMDSFQLWRYPGDWLTLAIACPILTLITVVLCKNRAVFANLPTGKLPLFNILGLSYLHWGWQLPNFPVIAIYVAMIGTTIITIYHYRYQPQPSNTPANQSQQQPTLGMSLFAAVIIYGLGLLLVRAIFVTRVDVTQLGLAIGICGWLVTWLAQYRQSSSPQIPWQSLGVILLVLGWLVSVVNHPGQTIAVSGLGLWFVGSRLQRYSLRVDLAAFFAIGLQTVWLGWRLVPAEFQKLAIAVGTQLTYAQNEPWALLSVALFPYLIFMVVVSHRLHRAQKPELARFGEILSLLLGICLTTIALVNPTLLTLNLLFSTITLAVITKRRSLPFLVFLTHIVGVLTLGSTIHWLLPTLAVHIWAGILLTLMVGEWVFALSGDGLWRHSAWYIGLALATLSFSLLWFNAELVWYGNVNPWADWGVIWLITPVTLTALASRTNAQRRPMTTFFSVITVIMTQLLTLPLPTTRLIGLGVATAVMFANTRYLRNQATAKLTIGFALSFIGALLWANIPVRLTIAGWFVAGAIAIFSLWLARTTLNQRDGELATIYAVASDQWAIALCSVELLGMTLHSTLVYQGIVTPGLWYLTATVITLAAITYRSWQSPSNWAFYGIGWGVELFIAEVLGFGERAIIHIAIANIALGLITQLLGEWWRRRYQLERLPSSLHILPLIYGAFSVVLRLDTFTNWTGLCTLGVALILVGVGRRRENFKPLLYLGLIGVSLAAYELLFYQMLQASGGGLGDGLIAMSALGTSIMYAYRILTPWIVSYLRLTYQELKGIAHLHWLWSSCLLMAAIPLPIDVNRLVGLATGAFLIRYAFFQGRRSPDVPSFFGTITMGEMWVYLGLLQVAAMRVYWRETAVGQWLAGPLVPWNGAIACVVAYFLYILPWERWGWSKRPWQQVAYIIPLIILWETRLQVYPITLLLAAGFYIFLAKVGENIRWTYISAALINAALWRWFNDLLLSNDLWYVTPIGLSLLYVAQVDTQLKLPEYKAVRHSLRLLGIGIICGWTILFNRGTPWIPGIFSLVAIFAGLALRIRAFLYVGTATFFIISIDQLVIFSLRYSFAKWVVGLLVGIILITIAANFETHRTQISSFVRNMKDELQEWE
ncbi:MAG: DUF2157 domain-containing protein [Nostoc sp. LLA-1]|nr:DUF2157 domain-containing protein [Cyanocohniella sp. LLY]